MKNNKTILAWTLIFLIGILPVFQWYFFGPDRSDAFSSENWEHSLGQITGLVGMTLFALTFVLATRIKKFEDFFGGLDKVYFAHSLLGSLAFALILMHPIFLVLNFVPSNFPLASKYLLPSGVWSVNFGIIALLGMIVLMYITFYTRIKYNTWKFSHEFFGLFFFFAVLHVLMVEGTATQGEIFSGYHIYAFLVSFVGLSCFLYSLLLRGPLKNKYYVVKEVNQKNGNLFEVIMNPVKDGIEYKSGQFVFLKFKNKVLGSESHPFSIASKSNSKNLTVIIKCLGDYTNKLDGLKAGDKVLVEGPYGRFNCGKEKGTSQVWIAGGIGVTPFIGASEDFIEGKSEVSCIDMYYLVRNRGEFLKIKKFQEIENRSNGRFRFIPWDSEKMGRIGVADIVKISGDLKDKKFYLCGPEKMKESLSRDFISAGAKEENIFTEEFDFRDNK